jgi:hypothetical protein
MNKRQKKKEVNTGVTNEKKKDATFCFFFSIRSYNELNRTKWNDKHNVSGNILEQKKVG